MSIPATINNCRSFPGIAAKLNLNHPAAQQARLAAVAIGGLDGPIFAGSMVNLVNSMRGTNGSGSTQKGHNSIAGPAIGTNTGVFIWLPTTTDNTFTYTYVAVFVAGVETATRILLSYAPVSHKLQIGTSGVVSVVMGGVTQTITPALPAVTTGQTYFFGFSTSPTAAPKTNVILGNLSTGAINTGTFNGNTNVTLTAGSGNLGVGTAMISQVNAIALSLVYLNPQQMLQWVVNDPWGLWYDRSAQNVMMMALHGLAPSNPKYAPLRQYLRR